MTNPGKGRKTGFGLVAALIALVAIVATGCGRSSDSSSSSSGGTLDVVGYSTPESVYQEALEPGFEATSAGKDVSFSNSFGASGDQSRAVGAGPPASEDSVVVIVTRKGNPEGVESFDDLLSKNVDVITPNPFSSGSARWNIMAVYGTLIHEGKSEAKALEGVKTLLEKTVVQPGSGRDALAAFSQGEGDVLLSYENEAIKAEKEGEDVEYVIPPSTIQIETPIAVTKDAPAAAQEFLDYIWSDAGQEIWAENGYRPVNPKLVDPKQFPTPKDLFKIAEFGGWSKVNDDFFDDETGKVAAIEKELGVSTSG